MKLILSRLYKIQNLENNIFKHELQCNKTCQTFTSYRTETAVTEVQRGSAANAIQMTAVCQHDTRLSRKQLFFVMITAIYEDHDYVSHETNFINSGILGQRWLC